MVYIAHAAVLQSRGALLKSGEAVAPQPHSFGHLAMCLIARNINNIEILYSRYL